MEQITQGENAGAPLTKPVAENLSIGDLAMLRGKKLVPTEPVVEAKAPPEQEEAVQPDTEAAEPETEEQSDVLSQEQHDVDLANLNEDEINELAKKLSSKAVARYGELTAKRKQAEAEVARLKAELAQSRNPLEKEAPAEDNPFRDVGTLQDLQDKWTQMKEVVEWAENLLDEHEESGADEVVAEIGGKEFTKREVRARRKQAQKALEQHLPQQLTEVQKREQAKALKSALETKVAQELTWMSGEDNDTRKVYEAIKSDPRTQKLTELVGERLPEVAAQLDYILAHFANSVSTVGRKEAPKTPSLKVKPAAQVTSSAAATPDRSDVRQSKALKELESRYAQSGSMSDFKALRTAQLSKR
jgi:hypothetical protein